MQGSRLEHAAYNCLIHFYKRFIQREIMGTVNNFKCVDEVAEGVFGKAEFPKDPEIERIRDENRKKRLELLFGDPNLTVAQVVTPIGDKEVEQEVKKLKEERDRLLRKDEGSAIIEDLEREVKKSKADFEKVMKEMSVMRQQQMGGIAEACENIEEMCRNVEGYVKKVEQTIKDLEEELERAQESQKKLREELQIAKNEEVKKSWAELRNGEGAASMATMMGSGEGPELKGILKKHFVPAKN
eukprot:GFUD01027661.1.p1 GENE.GFUD01027661.1~~GFUD01027661.1.p1  ORF type:complete len:242 (-),score=97.37 GFUD01027661.1:33-758(-)